MRTLVALMGLALVALASDYAHVQSRQATEPAATVPVCTAIRVIHPDSRRLVRRIDCVTGDTTVERRTP